jgi:GNAT superfamily N-acetyltransferase
VSQGHRAAAVRPLTAADDVAVAAVLARAFHDDPVMAFILRDPSSRLRRLASMFRVMMGSYRRHGGDLLATTDLAAVSLWHPPDRWRTPPAELVRTGPAMLRAMGTSALRGVRVLDFIERHHPAEPHWHLGVLGTDPPAQGRGHGGRVLQPVLDRCDAEGLPAYLESSKDRNVPYYRRFGFEVTEELTVPGGPTVWAMWREPR